MALVEGRFYRGFWEIAWFRDGFFVVKLWWIAGARVVFGWWVLRAKKMSLFGNISVENCGTSRQRRNTGVSPLRNGR
jgi:hypothetical protein